tara:strand:- start:4405 stop:5022 length:618 start_codon:yes stop_codon:yes gene_type:complete
MANKDKIKKIHDNTDFKISFAGVTQEGEFRYDQHGGSVQPDLDYHIHYTKDKKEVYMLGGSHTPTSKIIRRVSGPQTLFSQYDSIKTLTRQEYPSITPAYPVDSDYRIGNFTRYFAKSITTSDAPIFEVSEQDFENKNTLFEFVSFKWRISGIREEVVRINSVTVKNVNDQMPGIGRILSVLEFWRPPSNSPQTIQNKLSLLKKT